MLALAGPAELMMIPRILRPAARPRQLAILAMVAAFALPASAQGPAASTEQPVVVGDRADGDGASLLKANVARLSAASAPKPIFVRSSRPFAKWSVTAQAFRDSILVSLARTAVGTRYVRGGQSFASGFDCSGLVRYVMSALQVPVPRTAVQQATAGQPLGRDAGRLQPGDLLTFGRRGRDVSHVGIYVGNGRYVHASSVAGRVIESDIDRPQSPLVKAWRGTRRVLSVASPDSALKGDS